VLLRIRRGTNRLYTETIFSELNSVSPSHRYATKGSSRPLRRLNSQIVAFSWLVHLALPIINLVLCIAHIGRVGDKLDITLHLGDGIRKLASLG
jgi:hypothetical protein